MVCRVGFSNTVGKHWYDQCVTVVKTNMIFRDCVSKIFFFSCVFQELDLSNNYLDNLPAGLFRDMSNLTTLNLHNNSLTVMDRDLFQVSGKHRQDLLTTDWRTTNFADLL